MIEIDAKNENDVSVYRVDGMEKKEVARIVKGTRGYEVLIGFSPHGAKSRVSALFTRYSDACQFAIDMCDRG